MMKKNNRILPRFFAFALCLLLTAATLAFSASAEGKYPVAWDMDADGKTLYGDKIPYSRVELPAGYFLETTSQYRYQQYAPDGEAVRSAYRDSDVLWLSGYEGMEKYVFVSSRAKGELADFFGCGIGAKVTLRRTEMRSDVMESGLDTQIVTRLDEIAANDEKWLDVPVEALKEQLVGAVTYFDSTGTVSHEHGLLFVLYESAKRPEVMYYLNLDTLGNNFFSADGTFSYRNGVVRLSEVTDPELVKAINVAERGMKTVKTVRDYEFNYTELNTPGDEEEVNGFGMFLFWFHYALYGYLVPGGCVVAGILLTRKAKITTRKWWRLLTVFAIAWIVSTIGITVILAV